LSMASSNPAFGRDVFTQYAGTGSRTTTMTISGTVGKTCLLLAILTAAAGWTYKQAALHTLPPALLIGAAIGGFIVAMITIFKPTASPFTAPLYAALEGLFLGAISGIVDQRYHGQGLAVQAVALTFGTMAIMLFLYATRIIRVTQRLAMGIVAATGALFLVYFVSFILSMFHVSVPFLGAGANPMISIGFSLFVVGLAAFNLLLDFDFIERGAASGAPKVMEWYGAFGLMVTLVWLYLEILRLLMKLQDRR
jgi:uncharacterized YccA/Bax inhibitor family protein